MPVISINYVAVVVAAVASMVVGMVWYGPLFGKQWKALMGFTDESIKLMKMTPIQAMLGGLVSAFIMAYVLAHDHFVWGQFFGSVVSQYVFALQLAFWVWLGYVATTQLGAVLWEGKSWKLFFLNAGYSLVSLIVMALVLAIL